MIKLKDLVPLNLAEEKAKFFAAAENYNPQFVYAKNIPSSALIKHGRPKWRYLRLAKKIVKAAVKSNFLVKPEIELGPILTQAELANMVKNYLLDYQLADRYQVVFDENFVSRFAVNFLDNNIKVRLPINIDQAELQSVLDHEIGTHVLRQENYLQQPWYKKRKRYGLQSHLATEEGLAGIHFLLSKKDKLDYATALKYLAIDLANKKDFKTVYAFFKHHFQNSDRAWTYTLKIKRGLRDTSRKGGSNSGIVYFEGFVEVLKYLRRHQFNPTLLYYGKVAWQDLEKVQALKPDFQALLPKFYTDDPKQYGAEIRAIAKRNFIY